MWNTFRKLKFVAFGLTLLDITSFGAVTAYLAGSKVLMWAACMGMGLATSIVLLAVAGNAMGFQEPSLPSFKFWRKADESARPAP